MFPANQCPLCQRKAGLVLFNSIDSRVECLRCGNFKITRILYETILKPESSSDETKKLLPYLSAHTRQAWEQGEEVFLSNENWTNFALAHSNTSVSRKISKLLDLMAARSRPGLPAILNAETDTSLLDAFDHKELSFLLHTLEQTGYIANRNQWHASLSAKAWDQLQVGQVSGVWGKCFVAMSFDDSLKKAYEDGIFLAVKGDCKMVPVRLDFVQHNEKICDKIIAEIRSCQFVVSDVTLQRAGVYFEAGFAMGLGRPVIWSCREDDLKNVHFDTRQYNHIVWKESGDLRTQLAERIKATIPGAV